MPWFRHKRTGGEFLITNPEHVARLRKSPDYEEFEPEVLAENAVQAEARGYSAEKELGARRARRGGGSRRK